MNAATRRGTAERLHVRAGLLALLARAAGRGRTGKDGGATSVEYALMISLIALVIIASVIVFGRNAINLFDVPSSAFHL